MAGQVAAFLSARNECTRAQFKFNCEPSKIKAKLLYNYSVRCDNRNMQLRNLFAVDELCSRIAEWFTDKNSKCSLLIIGEVGTGKTTMLGAIRDFLLSAGKFNRMLKALSLQDYFLENDESFMNSILKGHWCDYLLLDDIGEEPIEIKSYGNSMFPYSRIISERYDRLLPVIVTSNLPLEEFKEVYGERTYDRMVEMFDCIAFTGDEKGNSFRQTT